jgi:Condensation domain
MGTDRRGKVIPHVICDYRSWNAVISETMAILQGREHSLTAVASYRDHVAAARKRLEASQAEQYFRRLADVTEPAAPFGLSDTRGGADQLEEAAQMLDPLLAQKIRVQARALGTSAARLFHAAWALVVARTSGQSDIVYGTVILASELRGIGVIARSEAWTNYPLAMTVDDLEGGFRLTGQADRRVGALRLIGYLSAAIQALVESLQHAPATPALSVPILPASGLHRVVESFNATAESYPAKPSLRCAVAAHSCSSMNGCAKIRMHCSIWFLRNKSRGSSYRRSCCRHWLTSTAARQVP